MKILITGARGFVGKNLVAELKNRGYDDIFEFNRNDDPEKLEEYCEKCDFVFHLAGVNRPQNDTEFMDGNFEFPRRLTQALERHENKSPILVSSSIQAALDNPYGKSKKAGEDIFLKHAEINSSEKYIYRFPNIFGKWCRPDYNSVIATFCNNIARDIPIKINDRNTLLTLIYIDDVVSEMINAINGKVNRGNDGYCRVPVEYKEKLGDIADLIYSFKESRRTIYVPNLEEGSFSKKLYSTYLSFLPEDSFSYPLKMNEDERGSFTEMIRTNQSGQFSVNISKPGIVKGNHWHHSKNEKFIVVSGKALIQFRRIDDDRIIDYHVSGDKLEAVDIPPGYTHNIINEGDEDLVTFMWCNECYNPESPDTYFLKVDTKKEAGADQAAGIKAAGADKAATTKSYDMNQGTAAKTDAASHGASNSEGGDPRLKLMTIIGTRPEIIRLSEVIKKCDKYFNQTLVHTGQNYDYELNQVFFEDLGLRAPDFYLDSVGKNLGETIGNIISGSYSLMTEHMPDALLILGDTNSCLSAISAKRCHIPIFHMEAGNRCFDECLPEETNRRIVDHISDVNMCYSEHARRYLNHEGTARERTYVTGSPMAEVLTSNIKSIKASNILEKLNLTKGKYILLSAHREENIDNEENFFSLMNAVNSMAEKYGMQIIYSTHPRAAKYIEKRNFIFHPNVRKLKPFGFHDYNCLQMNAFCVVSDSGTLPEESSYFNAHGMPFPAVCIRTSTERPEALDKGNFILAGITTNEVLQAVETAVQMNKVEDFGLPVPDYMDENVSTKVVKIIQSYTGVVNRMVWRKY